MDAFLNALKAQASALDASAGQPRFGTVSNVDVTHGLARVLLQPENVLTGWLPVLSPWVGAGWGLWAPPQPGDQVLVLAQEGEIEHGAVIARGWSAESPPPQAALGELVLQHSSGTQLRLANDGTVRVVGDLRVDGDVYDRHGSLSQLRGHYNNHAHVDPQGGKTSSTDTVD
jgi:phage baseplate assembly protein gpV